MYNSQNKQKKIKVLLEMRPALEGFAGIPQETRLLFRGLSHIQGVEVEGMIQTSHRTLARGVKPDASAFQILRAFQKGRKLNRFSRVIISMQEKPFRTLLDMVMDWVQKGMRTIELTLGTLLGTTSIRMTCFESENFKDFVWRTFFAKTLSVSDFELVTAKNFRVCSVPWNTMHTVGLNTLNFSPSPRYPRLNTQGVDIFIGQTPYPARINKNTALVIRYHDALPIFMPHTIPEKSRHQATHFYALMSNVKNGAWFACVSEATRQDLLRLFPETENRAVTIHNMLSQHYFKEADSSYERVPGIIRSRLYESSGFLPNFFSLREKETFYKRALSDRGFKYLLMVSTIEPRKNHTRLLAAWEVIKADVDPNIKLVVVGTLGWDNSSITSAFKPWIDRGELFMLNAVPAPDLRVLYRHAAATVCPSLGEGFDFSGAEAMASGGIVVASDIPVHREVYDDAAEYFDPYATMSLVKVLKKVLYEPDAHQVQQRLRERGEEVSSRYLPEKILPQWDAFFQRVISDKS